MYSRMMIPDALAQPAPVPEIGFWLTVAVVLIAHLLGKTGVWIRPALRLSAPMLGFGYSLLLGLALLLAPQGGKAFIYFQF